MKRIKDHDIWRLKLIVFNVKLIFNSFINQISSANIKIKFSYENIILKNDIKWIKDYMI